MKRIDFMLPLMAVILMAFVLIEPHKTTIFLAGDSTMSIKDTRAYPETGWGMPFTYFWDSTITVVNKAKNGRSTKTFISEGLWQSIVDNAQPGDVVLIQFGHNDEAKEKAERYTTPQEFKNNLVKFINDTKSKGAKPVLLTPVSRRKFDAQGNALQTHEIYSALVCEVAKQQTVLLIELDEISRGLYQRFGAENSKLLFLQLKPGEHPNYPEGKEDNTHFNELGARMVAQLVLNELKVQCPELAVHLVKPVKK